jgi:hypothetical protein
MVKKSAGEFDLFRQQHRAEISTAYATLGAHPEAPRAVVRRQWTGLYRMYKKTGGSWLAEVVRVRKLLEDAGLFW